MLSLCVSRAPAAPGRAAARGRLGRAAGLLAAVIALGACAGQGIYEDGTSLSFGPPNNGALVNPDLLPASGEGYWMPPIWARRGLHHGTAELVSMVAHLGRVLERQGVGRPLAVADLSLARGGPSAWHRSHQTGRDVDLIFFVRDAAGRPLVADRMLHFGADGASREEPAIHFDEAANWRLVRALVESPVADVQWIFISDDLKQLLLDHAIRSGEPAEIIAAAAVLLHQPRGALPHDDHMHIRIYCDGEDVALGCREIGPVRWFKKVYKYRTARRPGVVAGLDAIRVGGPTGPKVTAASAGAPGPGRRLMMAALPSLPFRGFVPR